jgi:hypothetical protein
MLKRLRLLAALAALAPGAARADIVELIDSTKIAGTIIHYFDGVLTVETGGQKMQIPREKVRSLTFKLPPPRPELGTPEKTFHRWRQAVMDGDAEKMLDCYALVVQGMLAFQLSEAGEEGMKRMRKEMEGARFTVKGAQQKGETATLKVQRQAGEDVQTMDLRFVKENGEWKMLPPQP